MSTIELIREFAKRGVMSCAVCDTAGAQNEMDALRDAVDGRIVFEQLYWSNCKRLPLWKKPLSELRQLWQTRFARRSTAAVVAAAHRWRAELIHTNTSLTPEGGRAALELNLPHVWHIREQIGPGKPFRYWGEGPRFGRYLGRRATKVIANSDTSSLAIESWLPDGLLEVIPNGLDLSRFSPATRPQRDTVVVGMVGNLSSMAKKHLVFIQAAAKLPKDLPVELRIYGHAPQPAASNCNAYVAEVYRTVERFGLATRLRFMGHVADPVQIMSAIDILVHPTERESFGRIFVEAMASGLPVIGMRGGGALEIVDDGVTGLLTTPDAPDELAAAIATLATDAEMRARFGEAGRRRAIEHYSIDRCAAAVLQVYAKAMAIRPPDAAIGTTSG